MLARYQIHEQEPSYLKTKLPCEWKEKHLHISVKLLIYCFNREQCKCWDFTTCDVIWERWWLTSLTRASKHWKLLSTFAVELTNFLFQSFGHTETEEKLLFYTGSNTHTCTSSCIMNTNKAHKHTCACSHKPHAPLTGSSNSLIMVALSSCFPRQPQQQSSLPAAAKLHCHLPTFSVPWYTSNKTHNPLPIRLLIVTLCTCLKGWKISEVFWILTICAVQVNFYFLLPQ